MVARSSKKPKLDLKVSELGDCAKLSLGPSLSLPTLCSFSLKRNLDQWVSRTKSVPLDIEDDDDLVEELAWTEYSDDETFSDSEYSDNEHILLVRRFSSTFSVVISVGLQTAASLLIPLSPHIFRFFAPPL